MAPCSSPMVPSQVGALAPHTFIMPTVPWVMAGGMLCVGSVLAASPEKWLLLHNVVLAVWHAGGRSAQIDARANRWDAQEYESLKAEREKLKREIDVSVLIMACVMCVLVVSMQRQAVLVCIYAGYSVCWHDVYVRRGLC